MMPRRESELSQRTLFAIALFALFASLAQVGAQFALTARASANASISLCVNRPPVITSIDDQSVIVGAQLLLHVNASDPDGQNFTFTDNTALFNITADGNISFLATVDSLGTHNITITVTDQGAACNASASDSFILTVSRAPSAEEAPPAPSPPRVGGGGGGSCTIRWECRDWGPCANGEQVRTCDNSGSCSYPRQREDRRTCEVVSCASDGDCSAGYGCVEGVCVSKPPLPPTPERPAPAPEAAPAPAPARRLIELEPAFLRSLILSLFALALIALVLLLWPRRCDKVPHCVLRQGHLGPHKVNEVSKKN